MTSKEELMKKIKALALKGEAGEKETASEMLKRLMNKYGITESEIEDDRKDFYWVGYSNIYEKKLVAQIMYAVTGDKVSYRNTKMKNKVGCKCTKAQSIEIEANVEFYKARLKEDMEIFFCAFINRNNIFAVDTPVSNVFSEYNKKVLNMAEGMERHEFRKQITGGEND